MNSPSFHGPILAVGDQFRALRRMRRLSQARLASATGLDLDTVVSLERSKGTVSSLLKALSALDGTVEGCTEPIALGSWLVELRKTRALPQRAAAELAGLSQPTAWCTDRLAGAEELSGVGEHPLSCPWMPIVPFKLNQDRRHHIPRQRRKVTNWPAYDASLRQRGSLTVWFTEEAVDAWAAEPRTTRGGQPWYSELAILTALTLRAVFRLAFRQTEGQIGSIIGLLGLSLRVPDHTTRSRRAATLEVPRPRSSSSPEAGEARPVHLLVDSTGLKLCGPGEWLLEKHGTRTRRSWRKLHLGVDADTGQIVAT